METSMNSKISDKISKINDLNFKQFTENNNNLLIKIENEINRLLKMKNEKSNPQLIKKEYEQTTQYKNLKKWAKDDYICGLLEKDIKIYEIFDDTDYEYLKFLDKNLSKLDFFPTKIQIIIDNENGESDKDGDFYVGIRLRHLTDGDYNNYILFELDANKNLPRQYNCYWSKYLDKIYDLSSKEDKSKMDKVFYYLALIKTTKKFNKAPNCIKQILLLS